MTATLRARCAGHPAATLAHDQLRALGAGDDAVELVLDWAGPVALPLAGEDLVQAACGIMHVHGRASGRPEPLAVDYATAVAGVLGAQGVLAAEFARARGRRVREVRTSVAQAALLAVGQYLACGSADPTGSPDLGSPPPFTSADGVRFEIETLKAEDWQLFWRAVGAPEKALRAGWPPFLHRFATAVCPLPRALHDTLAGLPIAVVADAGAASGVSVVPLGSHPPVPLWTFTPLLRGPVMPEVDAPAPLHGVRVVESTRRVQGPLAGHVLAMLGADVLRIEPPGGDPARGVPPLAGEVSARFAALNAGKRVVELDLSRRAGRAAARELVAGTDVFLHNWAPGRAESWRLTADDLATVRPGLVYAAASGWGPHLGDGPPLGTDYVVQARSGLAAALRPPGEAPAPSLMTVTDVLGGLVCAQGVLAALLRRARTGEGSRADTSLLSATGAIPRHRREFHRPLRTLDGYVAAPAAPSPVPSGWSTADLLNLLREREIPAAAVTTDLGRLAADPRFTTAIHRPPWDFA